MLALALQKHEDRTDPTTGQDIVLSTHPALAEYWTTMPPDRDFAATALAEAAERNKDRDHPETLRYIVGLREGWQEALAAWAERAATDQASQREAGGDQPPADAHPAT